MMQSKEKIMYSHRILLTGHVSQSAIKVHSTLELFRGRMSLGYAADQLERAEGIIALTAVFAELTAMLLFSDCTHRFQEISARRAMGVNVEYRHPFRQMLFSEGNDLLGEGTVVYAGCKADAVIG